MTRSLAPAASAPNRSKLGLHTSKAREAVKISGIWAHQEPPACGAALALLAVVLHPAYLNVRGPGQSSRLFRDTGHFWAGQEDVYARGSGSADT